MKEYIPETKRNKIAILLILFLLLSVLDFWGIYLLRKHGEFVRLESVTDLRAVGPSPVNRQDAKILANDFHSQNPAELLEQVMGKVSKVETFPSSDIRSIYQHVNKGGGLVCGGMSTLYFHALAVNDIKARYIALKRNIFDIYDIHTTVEVFVDGKWVIYDPTFNVSFVKNGELVGAQDIKNSLYDGSFEQIEPVFYGDVLYPARLESYYMHWLSLYNNVFVYHPSQSVLTKIPPFRYWFGPVYYFEADYGQRDFPYQIQDQLYFIFVGVLPIVILTISSVIIVLFVFPDHKSQGVMHYLQGAWSWTRT
jgi:hypothetical protein